MCIHDNARQTFYAQVRNGVESFHTAWTPIPDSSSLSSGPTIRCACYPRHVESRCAAPTKSMGLVKHRPRRRFQSFRLVCPPP